MRNTIEFIPGLDTTGLTQIAIGGIGSIEIVDECMVMMTFVGVGSETPCLQLLWTIPAWFDARARVAEIAEQLAKSARALRPLRDGAPKHH